MHVNTIKIVSINSFSFCFMKLRMHGKLRNIRFYLKSFFFPFFFPGNLLQVVGLGLSTVYVNFI
jgi:hypothetical protein